MSDLAPIERGAAAAPPVPPAPDAAVARREAAVIDVGSNSVRLVAYRLEGRAMTPFLNEKVMAGLGRQLGATGRLRAEGVVAALAALRRFRALIDGLGLERVEAVATAAVRSAEDGLRFVDRVRTEAGIDLRVIEGAEEARLSALGVVAGAGHITGVVGDLGGSSLELTTVQDGAPGAGETFPLGPLALMNGGPFATGAVAEAVAAALARSAVLAGGALGPDFYAVGGAWRALGRIDIALRGHPLGVLHHHAMSRADVLKVCAFVAKQSKRSLERLEEAAAKRAEALPYAAVVLEQVVRLGGFERVILSSYGLREGLLFAGLGAREQACDPLIASAEAFSGAGARGRRFGAALAPWLEPVFSGHPTVFSAARDPVLRAAAARLADIGGALHPDQRPQIMFDLVLRAPLAGLGHAERAFLAGAAHHRYTKGAPKAAAFTELLSEEQRRAAATLGLALRLGADVSGRSSALLGAFTLGLEAGVLTLQAAPGFGHLLTEQAARRLEPLAQALGVPAALRGG